MSLTTTRERTGRRGLLGLIGKAGMAAVGGVASVTATAPAAQASAMPSPCCHLASNRLCPGGCNYYCPEGYYRSYWSCTSGRRLVWCGECQWGPDRSCWSGWAYACSIWKYDDECFPQR